MAKKTAKRTRAATAARKPSRPARPAGRTTAARAVKPVPAGYHTATPYLTVRNAAAAIDFYKRALGAVEKERMPGPGGKLMHAELAIGDSIVMLSDEFPEMGGGPRSPESLGGITGYVFLYVPDVDATMRRAVEAGAHVTMPATDMFWGDRFGKVKDPFGHEWGIATHKEDLSADEIRQRAQAAMAQMGNRPS